MTDIEGYLLKEYEHVAEAYFKSHEITGVWLRFYFLIIAAPSSVIAFLYNGRTSEFDINSLPDVVLYLTLLIGVLGFFLTVIIVNYRVDSTLYARTVNGIRKYFRDNSSTQNIDKYLVLPTNMNKPEYFKYFGDLSVITIITGIVNSLYLSVSISQLYDICFAVVLVSSFALHFAYYAYKARSHTKKYGVAT